MYLVREMKLSELMEVDNYLDFIQTEMKYCVYNTYTGRVMHEFCSIESAQYVADNLNDLYEVYREFD